MIVFMPAVVAGPGGGAVLDGVLERVTFANPETGYTIARIAPERGGTDLVTAVGPLLGAQIGEFLRLRGRWSSHPKYGRQFEVASYATVLPATAAGIQKYPAVVIPLVTSSWMMLQRNLLYTGITRARELVVLAGSRRALAAATPTSPTASTHTPSPSPEPPQHRADPLLGTPATAVRCHVYEFILRQPAGPETVIWFCMSGRFGAPRSRVRT